MFKKHGKDQTPRKQSVLKKFDFSYAEPDMQERVERLERSTFDYVQIQKKEMR